MACLCQRFRFTCPFSHLHSPRFHKPPYDPGRSDFPSPVLVSALHAIFRIKVFPIDPRLKCWFTYTPWFYGWPVSSPHRATDIPIPALRLGVCDLYGTTEYPEPLCPVWQLPSQGWFLESSRKTLLSLHSSYGLMRQTESLLSPRFPCVTGPCRLSPVPAGRRPFPTLSLQSLCRRLDPYPVVSPRCFHPFLPWEQRPHATGNAFGTRDCPCHATSTGSRISWLQSFVHLQAPTLARPPGRTHRWAGNAQGGQAVHTTHRPDGYPLRDVASLHVRHG